MRNRALEDRLKRGGILRVKGKEEEFEARYFEVSFLSVLRVLKEEGWVGRRW